MPRYLELDVSLRGVEPTIWRQFWIRDSASFAALHSAIQTVAGWHDGHLYGFFELGRRRSYWDQQIARDPRDEGSGYGFELPRCPRADKLKLSRVLADRGDKCLYVYDYGDNWELDIKVLSALDSVEKFKQRLIAGGRAFPPEDCGSYPGYEDIVVNFNTPADKLDEDARDQQRWVREMEPDWHPERFDLAEMKRRFDRAR